MVGPQCNLLPFNNPYWTEQQSQLAKSLGRSLYTALLWHNPIITIEHIHHYYVVIAPARKHTARLLATPSSTGQATSQSSNVTSSDTHSPAKSRLHSSSSGSPPAKRPRLEEEQQENCGGENQDLTEGSESMEQGQMDKVKTGGEEHEQTEDQPEGMEQGQTDSMEPDTSSEQEESTMCNETKTEDDSKTEAESDLAAVASEDNKVVDKGVDKGEGGREKEIVEKKTAVVHPFFCECMYTRMCNNFSSFGSQLRLLCEL